MTLKIHFTAFVVAAALSGCTSGKPAKHPVSARAPADLDCPEADLVYTPVDESMMDVQGCGRSATYVEHCKAKFNSAASATMGMPTSSKHCRWVLQ